MLVKAYKYLSPLRLDLHALREITVGLSDFLFGYPAGEHAQSELLVTNQFVSFVPYTCQ